MADQLRAARVTGATLGSDLPARIGELETAISIITGVPLDVLIASPMNEVVAAGLRKVIFQDLAGDPTAAGELGRSGNLLRLHNGLGIGTVSLLIDKGSQTPPVSNTAAETALWNGTIRGGMLGSSNKIRLKLLTRLGLLNGGIAAFLCYYGGTLGANLTITNSSGGTVGLTPCPIEIELCGNGTGFQIFHAECRFGSSQSNVNAFGALVGNLLVDAGLAIDSTVDKALQVNVLFLSGASVSNQCDTVGSVLEFLG